MDSGANEPVEDIEATWKRKRSEMADRGHEKRVETRHHSGDRADRDGFFQRVDDDFNLGSAQFRKHRQGNNLACSSFSYWKCATLVSQATVSLLQMNRHWIMNATRDTHSREQFNHLIPPRNTDCIDVIDVPRVVGGKRCNDFSYAAEGFIILPGVGPPEFIPFLEVLQLDSKDSGLNTVHACVPPNHRVMVLVKLAVIS